MESKLAISVNGVTFSGEGDADWLSVQLDKVLKAAAQLPRAELASAQPAAPPSQGGATAPSGAPFNTTLAEHIKAHNANRNQTKRFLVTADWLRRKGGLLSTANVKKALSDNHQAKIGNAPDILNKNVSKGFIEKEDGGFYITPLGLRELGYTE